MRMATAVLWTVLGLGVTSGAAQGATYDARVRWNASPGSAGYRVWVRPTSGAFGAAIEAGQPAPSGDGSISILVPVLMPVIVKVGIDPVHFGVMMTLNLMIGLLHPPLGMVLFVLSRVAKLSIERTTMAILPWLIPLLLSLIAITMIPELTLWLPKAVGMIK